jgi:molybdopterin synthase catalytic subunit
LLVDGVVARVVARVVVVPLHRAECTDVVSRNIVGSGPPGWPPGQVTTMARVRPPDDRDWIALTHDPLPVDSAIGWATTRSSGAVVVFLGVVRDHSEGRAGVQGLTYEAYEQEALARLTAVAADARRRWPVVERLALLHRIGDLALSEASVAVVASSPHRPEAFEAARYCIDTLKETVPIWKREHWEGGSDWGQCAHDIRPVDAELVPDAAARPSGA